MRRRWLVAVVVAALVAAGIIAAFIAPMRLYLRSQLLSVGSPAPVLSAPDQDGVTRSIAAERGRPLVVYFYPKDDTPGCTAEACAFRDAWDAFTEANVAVLGVSGDAVGSKKKFAEKYRLPFPVVSDPSNEWAAAFGVRVILGLTARVTFLVDRDGRIAKIYPDVDPGVHVDQVLADALALGAAPTSRSQPAAP